MPTVLWCLPQSALGDEGHDSVAVNFFGDGTANNGAPPYAPPPPPPPTPQPPADNRAVWAINRNCYKII